MDGSNDSQKRKEILMKYVFVSVIIVALLRGVSFAGEKIEIKDENDRVNYSYGYRIGENLKRQAVKINPEVLMTGIQDALSGVEPRVTQEDMQQTLKEFSKQNVAARKAQERKMAEQYRKEGKEFLAANAKEPGVVTLPNGLQYKVIREGTGKIPGPHDTVTVNYRGTLIDGTEFDNSYRRGEPATFKVNGLIRGWTEALQLMKEGAKWQLFIPPDLAYAKRSPLAHRTLIFDVELISVESSEK
jgi:FKBP-type peptidyl-prolyl cis-trans isomerase FklB